MPTSRDKLIQTAIKLFLEHGFSSTTVDEICARADVAKGSFYYAFKSKEDLGVVALEAFDTEHNDRFVQAGFLAEQDSEKRLFGFLDYLISESGNLFELGCLLGSMSLEVSDELPKIRKRLHELFVENLDQIESLISGYLESLDETDLPSAKSLSEKLVSQIEGALVLAKATDDWDILPRMLTLYRDELKALSSN